MKDNVLHNLILSDEILKNTKQENKKTLASFFKKAGVRQARYISFISTLNLINTPILKDLGVYLLEIGEKVFISYYSDVKKALIIDENQEPISKSKTTIEELFIRLSRIAERKE